MKIGLLQINIYMPNNHSLKDKRMRLSRIKSALRKEFNISIAELKNRQRWQFVLLGIVVLGDTTGYVDKTLDSTIKYIKKFRDFQIIDYEIQLM